MGSVVLLWGEAGSPVVELRHLKQPAGEVGPLTLVHRHLEGVTEVERGPADPLAVLAGRPNGITADDLACLEHPGTTEVTRAMKEKARRRLDALAKAGKLDKVAGQKGGEAGGAPTRYHLVGHR
jgi:replicative DNA helicase